ncbi:MAG: LPS assembly lipoprotein LptE [Candidatus Binataceae bacterium]
MRNAIRLSLTRLALMMAAVALCASGCGYHFAASGSGIPVQAKTIYVARFSNRTRFNGANDQLMRYIKDEIANHKRLDLVDDPSQADLVLSGDVYYMNNLPVAFNSVNEPTISNETIAVDAVLVDAHTHKTIWRTNGLSESQQFSLVSQSVVTTAPTFLQQNLRSQDIARMTDIQVAQSQESFSRGQMMDQLSKNLYASMSEGF